MLWSLLVLCAPAGAHDGFPYLVGLERDTFGVVLSLPTGERIFLSHNKCTDLEEDNIEIKESYIPLMIECGNQEIKWVSMKLPIESLGPITVLANNQGVIESAAVMDGNWITLRIDEDSKGLLTFIYEGFLHLVLGADHILILLLLTLYSRSLRELISCALAFSLGHFLIIMSLGLIGGQPNYLAIEGLIAMSILMYARAILIEFGTSKSYVTNGDSWKIQSVQAKLLWLIIGVIHGAGLGAGIFEQGLIIDGERWGLIKSILAFGIGIDVAQLMLLSIFWVIKINVIEIKQYHYFARRVVFICGLAGSYQLLTIF
ncbi:MAG: hypothetical protein ACI8SK_001180 [Shewanella sp.]|jgi:hypothetical protein